MREFVAAAEAVPEAAWQHSPGADKWSPAQIAEHLRITYEVMLRELRGGQGVRVRLGWFQRLVLRQGVMRRILRGGVFPKGAPAVRELRPGGGPFERRATLAELGTLTDDFASEIAANRNARLSHPFFGKLGAASGLRILAAHNRHHRGQLPTSA